MTEHILDHTSRALARLPEQHKDQPNIAALIAVMADPIQAIEDALWALLVERTLDLGVGAQLDAIGELVGQARGGLVDDDFRRYIRARITANKSNATVDELLHVTELVLFDPSAVVRLTQYAPAAVVIWVSMVVVSDALAVILVGFLRKAAAAAVRMLLEYSSVVNANLFYWDTGTWDSGKIYAAAIE